jgi:GT2 family glycosyltransferase
MAPGTQENSVSVIVVNWNGAIFLKECLEALFRQTYPSYEVILVDNASSDSSVSSVRKGFPQTKVVELSENKGFTGGNVEGLKVAEGEFIALVNNDARVDEKWLERLVEPMLRQPTVGICASRLLLEKGSRINSAGGAVTSAGVGFDRGFGEAEEVYNKSEFVFGASGAAALYRRRMIEEIGFLDEEFFLYGEDTDLSFRAQLAGWKCAYVATATASHKWQGTSRRLSDVHVYYHNRNLEFVWLKNMPAKLMVRYTHHKMLQEMGSLRTYAFRLGKWRPFFRAKRDALRMAPGMLRKRKAIQRTKKVSDEYIESLLTPIFGRELRRHKKLARLASPC